MATEDRNIGGFTVDTAGVVRTWDPWMARITGIAAEAARGRAIEQMFPDLDARGVLAVIREVVTEGTVHVLAPAFHRYLVASAPARPSRHFNEMQQRVTIGPLREGIRIVGAIITVEDVTDRLDGERDLAERGPADTAAAAAPSSEAAWRAALREEDWRVRRLAADQMARAGGQAMVSSLLSALREEHDNFSVVSSALQILSQLQLDVVEPLIEFLRAPDAPLRIQAALGLGEQRDRRAIAPLVAALGDADANVRFHAIEALGKLRATDAADSLLEIAHSGDFFQAFAALDALARIGEPRVAPLLMPLLDDEMLRNAVVDTLGEVGDEATVDPLVRQLDRKAARVDSVVLALLSLQRRTAERFGEGVVISDRVRQRISPTGIRTLVDAATATRGEPLRSLAIVLGWLEGEVVERTLAHLLGDATARREVVEALVRYGPRVVDLLLQQLGSDSIEARQAAIIALGRIGDRRATTPLLDLLARDRDTLLTTAGALSKIGDPAAFEPLLAYLADEDPAVRQAAIAALNSIGHPSMVSRIAPLLEDADPRIRESAVKIAGYFGYRECIEALFARCHDENEDVRRAALDHLAFLDDPRLLPTLIEAVRHDTPRARAAAAHALGRIDDEAARAAAIEALGDLDAWVRYFATRAVGRQRATDAVPVLAARLRSDPAMQVRFASVEALGEIGTAEAVATLAPLCQAESELRAAALRALGNAVHEHAWPLLRQALESGDPVCQIEAIHAVAVRGGHDAASLLEWVAAASAEPAIIREAILALGRLATAPGIRNGPGAVGALVDLTADPVRREPSVATLGGMPASESDRIATGLSDPRIDVRCAVVEALGRIRHQRATTWVQRALDDRAPEVRKVAIVALSHLGSRGTESKLVTLARGDPDPSVRDAAIAALKHLGAGRAAPPADDGERH